MLKKGMGERRMRGSRNMYMHIYTHDTGSINFRLLSLSLSLMISLAAHAFLLDPTIVEYELCCDN